MSAQQRFERVRFCERLQHGKGSAIDAAAEARIFRRLFAQQGKTIITISHRYSTVKKADAIYVITHGRIVEHGTAAALMAQRGVFYEMFKEQI